ncbi:hypothetical protein M436DRAFT_36984 [Aureobasidium namibiae CBS 147.97]|uniref:Uncharacterized protein n=1 Tax=Aureobasidium namibiae CBS 147.97 TaxID=1043004 RepID=A0A074X0Y4_9PEZI|nr:uncharacterized protein M436DRAFT_36984 [Aureobasidium namibiae CBS 147.97]KEQ77444.1 hypothetical protein M436DRAFT_36984 [Aureobasidium namibiae CBS 147.97]
MLSFLSRAFVVSKVGILGSTSLCLPTTWRFFSQSQTRYATPEDPEARRKRLDKNNERRRQRYQNDPDYREKQAMRLRTRIWHEQMRDQKPEVLEQFLERTRLAAARSRAGDPRFKFRVNLHKCLVSHAWEPEELPWKTHVPMVSAEKVFRQCARCDRSPPGGGLRLWYVYRVHDMRYSKCRCSWSKGLCKVICKQQQADHI